MSTRTCRVGLHGRNDVTFEDVDYQVIQEAKIETVKMMSHTEIGVFRRLHDMNVELITRLHDDRIGKDSKVTAQQFAERMVAVMNERRPYCQKFQIHNEPNHLERKEGWGPEEEDAKDFNLWFQRVYRLLKVRLTVPVGPFRCLPMMISAFPFRSSLSRSYSSPL